MTGLTYEYERIRCGKPSCRCARGELHGPYWYVYWRDSGGKLRKRYVGKTRPTACCASCGHLTSEHTNENDGCSIRGCDCRLKP